MCNNEGVIIYTCPANHSSETPEFCSVCGLEISGAVPPAVAPAQASAAVTETQPVAPIAAADGSEACPDCGAPRENIRQAFCEICGYNFVTRAAGSGPPQAVKEGLTAARDPTSTSLTSDPPAEAGSRAPAVAKSSGGVTVDAARWEVTVTVDANLYGMPNPDAPAGQPLQRFRLFDRETMIGRAGSELRVQVPVHGCLQSSLRDGRTMKHRRPWVETHGYHRSVATRRVT